MPHLHTKPYRYAMGLHTVSDTTRFTTLEIIVSRLTFARGGPLILDNTELRLLKETCLNADHPGLTNTTTSLPRPVLLSREVSLSHSSSAISMGNVPNFTYSIYNHKDYLHDEMRFKRLVRRYSLFHVYQ